ncbi:hypothetical protein CAC42_7859 [Sphaceloma murrayae]|uniref:Sas10 C-terminal domain-containing protein n=1 Tax=Sphaceloma murrayae TaxID=2082308 RepID=A0A2K1QXW7_9PEZI|nr:hypothetical protein CAC42_7859 [Sphaceloma murrayae]
MAKKRKAPGSSKAKPAEDFNKRVRLNVNSYEDVAGSDDEFQIGRDEVLLGESTADKRSRKLREEEQFLEASDEEVLDYSDEDPDAEEDEAFDDGPQTNGHGATGAQSDDDEDDDGAEEDELNEWGASKQEYYGADEMETEQDALDEEAEAKRLQQKQLEALTAADYGFDEDEWAGEAKLVKQKPEKSKTVTEVLPQLKVSDDMGPAERLKLLKSRYPEFEPLSKEFLDIREELDSLQQLQAGDAKSKKPRGDTYNDGPAPTVETKIQAATAYLATLAMYFALLTYSTSDTGVISTSPTALRDHPVMDSLLSSRSLWLKVKDLPQDDSDWESETEEDIPQQPTELPQPLGPRRNRNRNRKTRAEKAALAAQRAAEAQHLERLAAAEADLADLDNLLARKPARSAKSSAKTNGTTGSDSDFGEVELSEKALADKAARRKSLRFYTSQIAQKSNKRGAAGRSAGGDDDIPYRERLRDRQARLVAEAAKKGRRDDRGADLGGESGSEDEVAAKAIRADAGAEGEGDYYQFISGRKKDRKEEKESLAAARKEAIMNGGRVVEQEMVGEDGKRKISYAIEKNKGLTPHRKKENRNPRVKKRKRFDDKKKKLASMKATYKGGEGKGGYGGELSGIKSNLVKSRKL